MYFIGGGLGGRGTLPADNTPAQRKTPLKPPPFLNLALQGVLSMISDFRESPPPLPQPPLQERHCVPNFDGTNPHCSSHKGGYC